MLELQDVRVAYRGVEVVHGVSLRVREGEVVGIIGPNGAGKSSLLRAICGLVRPSGGQVSFDGHSLIGSSPEAIARRGISLVPEGRQIFRTLTVEENLQLGLGSAREPTPLKEAYRRFPILSERRAQRADRLSGGEQQQLALARALLGEPKLLILDEPSLGLAPKAIDSVYGLLERLGGEGATLLLVEQNAARTMAFCERTLVLSGGALRAEGTAQELRSDPDLLQAYLGGQP